MLLPCNCQLDYQISKPQAGLYQAHMLDPSVCMWRMRHMSLRRLGSSHIQPPTFIKNTYMRARAPSTAAIYTIDPPDGSEGPQFYTNTYPVLTVTSSPRDCVADGLRFGRWLRLFTLQCVHTSEVLNSLPRTDIESSQSIDSSLDSTLHSSLYFTIAFLVMSAFEPLVGHVFEPPFCHCFIYLSIQFLNTGKLFGI